jgi:hypothetical protein
LNVPSILGILLEILIICIKDSVNFGIVVFQEVSDRYFAVTLRVRY